MGAPLPASHMFIGIILSKFIITPIVCNPIWDIISQQVRLNRVCHVICTFQRGSVNTCAVSCFITSDNKSGADSRCVYALCKTFISLTIKPNAHRRYINTEQVQNRLRFFPCSFWRLSMRETIDTPRDTPSFTFFCVSYPCVFFGTSFRNFDDDTLNPCGLYSIIINIALIIRNVNYFICHLICPPSSLLQSEQAHP